MSRRVVQLVGGPLDGLSFEATPPTRVGGELVDGAYMLVPGELARAVYEPAEGDQPDRWHFRCPSSPARSARPPRTGARPGAARHQASPKADLSQLAEYH